MAESPSELQVEIEKLESRHTEHPEGRFFVPLANAYRKIGEVEHAEALLREGLRQHPDYLSAHIVLGRCLADRGATDDAAEEFRFVLTMDPQNLIALRTLGELSVTAGRTDEAIRWYEQLLSVDPMNEEARRALESLPVAAPQDLDADFEAGGGWWQAPVQEEAPYAHLHSGPPAPAIEDAAQEPDEMDDLPFLSGAEPLAPQPASGADYFGQMLDLDEGPFQAAGETEDPEEAAPGGEVVTETIAELYARQGLHDRAAEVYRELIRRRGGDPTLERRLAELGAASGGPGASPSPVPPSVAEWDAPVPAEDGDVALPDAPALPQIAGDPRVDDVDPFAGSFELGFEDDAPEVVNEEEAMEEETEELASFMMASDPAPAGPTISTYLGELIQWRPGRRSPVAAAEAESLPVALPEPEPAPPELAPPLPELSGTTLSAVDDAFPWETGVEPAPREEQPAEREDLFSFDHFFAESAPAEPPPAPAPPPQPVEAPAPSPAAGEEEDDLESFQAWLRSLKR